MRTIHRDIVGAFIFSRDNKVLLGQSIKGGVYQNLWVVPGGGIEDGETKLEALIREIQEEVGLDIRKAGIEQLTHVSKGQSEKILRGTGERVIVVMTFYDFKVSLPFVASKLPLRSEDDFTDATWFSPEEIETLMLGPPTAAVLEHLSFLQTK
ncbi:MAG: hypothetical protein JWM81_3 [Candidatus Saccharibacteria bacterium]|nr:hypothetical protein [Candidatus Saccharibacteria bacterium]